MATDKFEHLERCRYEDIRDLIQTGDIFLASGNYPISRIIRHFSDSMFSHVGFLFRWNNRILILESVEDDGVRAAPLSQYVNDYECGNTAYDGRLFLGRYNAHFEKYRINEMLGEAADLLNRKYNRGEIGEILARLTIGLGRHTDNNAYICSEFVDACFRKIGVTFPRTEEGFIFPEHIAADPEVRPMCEIDLS